MDSSEDDDYLYQIPDKHIFSIKEVTIIEDLFKAKAETVKEKIELSGKNIDEALTKLTQTREAINNHFDKLENEIREKALEVKDEDSRKLQEVLDACMAEVKDIEDTRSNLEKLEDKEEFKQMLANFNSRTNQRQSVLDQIASTNIRLLQLCQGRKSNNLTLKSGLLGHLKMFKGKTINNRKTRQQKRSRRRRKKRD
jgi:uncharacterized protein YukE